MIATVRVRGKPGVKPDLRRTLDRLGLSRTNSCVLLPEDDSVVGKIRRVNDYVTWGELDGEGAEAVLGRADVSSRKKLTGDRVEAVTGYSSIEELTNDLVEGEVTLTDVGLKRTVRLHPPRKGYRDTKAPYPEGSLGHRGEEINELLRRMR
ncbi:MAG: 50S ribosomal protein L30 [Methanonatronarchaeales archaeon]|nr:50S ribosomal protein L30 [Methanonatronarchaeales archaeon]